MPHPVFRGVSIHGLVKFSFVILLLSEINTVVVPLLTSGYMARWPL